MPLEGLPWSAITAAGGGWALFGLTMFGLITGRWIVTRREADRVEKLLEKRAESAEKARDTAVEQNTILLEVNRIVRDTFAVIKNEAEK